MITKENNMKDFTDFMVNAMCKINNNVENLYNELKLEVEKIGQDIRNNTLNLSNAMQEFDVNISGTLNRKISEINRRLNEITNEQESYTKSNLKDFKESLKYEDYINSPKVKLDDYSNIYIMYSKLIEAELFKCLNINSIGNKQDISLGKIIAKLVNSNSSIWNKFEEEVRVQEIQLLRNHSAHNRNSGDGRITEEHVKNIREFLFNESINKT